jgi:hypothetical protein
MIAFAQAADVATDLFDDAGALVAEKSRQRERGDLALHAEVGVADPGGDDAHEDLVVAWLLHDDVAYLKRSVLCCGDRALGVGAQRLLLDRIGVSSGRVIAML